MKNFLDTNRTGTIQVVAWILLFISGFITNILGLLLLSPTVRHFNSGRLSDCALSCLVRSDSPFISPVTIPISGDYSDVSQWSGYTGNSKVVDLHEEEFHREEQKDRPGRANRTTATCKNSRSPGRTDNKGPITKGCKTLVKMINSLHQN